MIAVRIVALVAVLLASCSKSEPPQPTPTTQQRPAKDPEAARRLIAAGLVFAEPDAMLELTETQRVLRNAVAAAIMAPSSHNTQPWRFRIVDDRLEVLADSARHLSVIDRDRRQLVMSCGCALFTNRCFRKPCANGDARGQNLRNVACTKSARRSLEPGDHETSAFAAPLENDQVRKLNS